MEAKEKAQTLVRHFPDAEARIEELASLAPNASPDVSKAVREAAVRFYRGTRFINETAGSELDTKVDGQGKPIEQNLPSEVRERFGQSWSLLLDAVGYLEDAIDDDLFETGESLPA